MGTPPNEIVCGSLVQLLGALHGALSMLKEVQGWQSWEVTLSDDRRVFIAVSDVEGSLHVVSSDEPVSTWQQVEEILSASNFNF